jgi:hypothetical protein
MYGQESDRRKQMMIRWTVMLMVLTTVLCPLGQINGMWNFERLQDPKKRALREHYELEKDTFLTAEPIFVVILLENTGNEPECCLMQEAWNLGIEDASGASYPARTTDPSGDSFEVDTTKPCPPGYWTVLPGARPVTSSRNLLVYYGNGRGPYGFYLPPGSYKLFSKWFPSDTILIHVVTPPDSKELEASRLLVSAADKQITDPRWYSQAYQFYGDFVKKYPNSVYTPMALDQLLAIPPGQPPEYTKAEEQTYAQKMIRDFPTSRYFYYALLKLDLDYVKVEDRGVIMVGLQRGKVKLKAEDLRKRVDELVGKLKK